MQDTEDVRDLRERGSAACAQLLYGSLYLLYITRGSDHDHIHRVRKKIPGGNYGQMAGRSIKPLLEGCRVQYILCLIPQHCGGGYGKALMPRTPESQSFA